MVCSGLAGWFLFQTDAATVDAYLLTKPIAAGEPVTLADLRLVSLPRAAGQGVGQVHAKFSTGQPTLSASHSLQAGSLLEVDDLTEGGETAATLAIPIGAGSPELAVGDSVDLWWVDPDAARQIAQAQLVVATATDSGGRLSVSLRVQPAEIAEVLQAVAADAVVVVKSGTDW